jgi:hypothetical protein
VGEKLSKFIELFNTNAAASVERSKVTLDKFTAVREIALKLTAPVNEEYKTLGSLIEKMIPESGILDDSLFREVYAKTELEKEDKAVVSDLFKLKSAPNSYNKAVNIKEKGGESYFNSLMQEIGNAMSSSSLSFDDVVGKDIKGFVDFLYEGINSLPEGPVDLSSPELYAAVVENGTPIGKKEEAKSSPGAINETLPKKGEEVAPKLPSTSAVNPEKAAETLKTEVESTSSQVTSVSPEVPAELEKKEKQAININIEKPEVPSEITTTPTQVVNQGNQSTTSVQNTTVNSEVTTQNQTNLTSAPASTQINDMSSKKTENSNQTTLGGSKSITQQALELGKQYGFSEKELKELALGSTINSSTLTNKIESLTKNQSKTATSSTANQLSSSTSSINEGEEESETATSTDQSIINDAKPSTMASGEKFDALVATAKKYGINTESFEKSKASSQVEEPEGNEEVSAQKSALPQTMEVSKTQQTLPRETTVEPVAQKQATALESQAQAPIEAVEKPADRMNAAQASESKPAEQAKPAQMIDLSGLENRMMRIEHLLANTLEVKIVE